MTLALSRQHLQDLHQKLGLIGQKAKRTAESTPEQIGNPNL